MGRNIDIVLPEFNPGVTDTPGIWGTGKYQVFNSSTSWTAPSGANRVRVTVLGGGGGAGRQLNNEPGNSCYCTSVAGAGGGAGYAVGISCVVPGCSYCVVVGAAGTHYGSTCLQQNVSTCAGGAGGASCFPGVCATGGGGGCSTNHSTACACGGLAGCGIGGFINRCGTRGCGAPGNSNNQSNNNCWGCGSGGAAGSPAGDGGATLFGGCNFDGTSTTAVNLDTLIAKYGLDLPKWSGQVLYAGDPIPGAGARRLPSGCTSLACLPSYYGQPGGGGASGGGGICNGGCQLGSCPGTGIVIVEY